MKLFPLLGLLLFAIAFSANAQFVTIWDTTVPGITTNTQISVSRNNTATFSYTFQDLTTSASGGGSASGFSPTITLPAPGRYRVTFFGPTFNNITMGGNGDGNKLESIESWGTVAWTSMNNAFSGCGRLVVNAPDSPNLTSCTSMRQMFEAATSVTGAGFENWNVGNVQDFTNTFAAATSFNAAIGIWDMHSATTTFGMFAGATFFDTDLSAWDVSNVTNMRSMFAGSGFNHNINNWNVSNVTDMSAIFANAVSFNQPLGNWDVRKCSSLDQIFNGAESFNQNINTWDVSNSNNFALMFSGASSYNQPLNNWDMSSCTFALQMFQNAAVFNQDISGWDMSQNTAMDQMFSGASQFNQNIGGWNVSNVTSMYAAFQDAFSFNQDLSSWNTTNVIYMDHMFHGASSFNGNITTWNTPAVTSMTGMFQDAASFNQNVANWNVSQVLDMSDIFHNSGLSDNNYDNALIGWARLSLQPSVTIGAQTNTYCASKNDREDIIADYGWFFFDGGEYCAPKILSFKPTSAYKGDKVVITGSNFTDANIVAFGDVDAASYTIDDVSTISAIIGDGETGTVAVTTPLGTGTLNGFTYLGEKKTAIITFRNSDNNSGNPISGQELIELDASQGKTVSRTFSIANTGNAADTIILVDVGEAFEVTESPTVIKPGTFEKLTITLKEGLSGDFSSTVIITFASGTVFQFSVHASVDGADLIVYNAVTPNGDGAHDFLKLLNIENFPGNKVVILDRLGNEVFTVNDYENNNSTKRFEGISNKGGGKNLTDGTYFYVISANNKKYTGFLLLQR